MSRRSDAPSWVDRLLRWADAASFPVWAFYLGLYVSGALMIHSAQWLDGVLAWGSLSPILLMNSIWVILPLGGIHYLSRTADAALDRFAPLLENKPDQLAMLRRRMTAMPRRLIFWLTLGWGLFVYTGVLLDPTFAYSGLSHPVSFVLVGTYFGLSYAMGPAIVIFGGRLLRSVSMAYALVDDVNPLRQGRLYSLAGLAMRTGLFFLAVVNLSIVSTITSDSTRSEEVGNFTIGVVITLLAIAALFGPARGIHRRLVDEKQRLLDENGSAVDRTLVKLYSSLDAEAHAAVENFDRGLESVLRMRTEIKAIPTWPWAPGALRGYMTAIVLPLVVWGAQQLLARYL